MAEENNEEIIEEVKDNRTNEEKQWCQMVESTPQPELIRFLYLELEQCYAHMEKETDSYLLKNIFSNKKEDNGHFFHLLNYSLFKKVIEKDETKTTTEEKN